MRILVLLEAEDGLLRSVVEEDLRKFGFDAIVETEAYAALRRVQDQSFDQIVTGQVLKWLDPVRPSDFAALDWNLLPPRLEGESESLWHGAMAHGWARFGPCFIEKLLGLSVDPGNILIWSDGADYVSEELKALLNGRVFDRDKNMNVVKVLRRVGS